MSGHISWIEHCWCIWSHTGQKRPHSSVLVFYCFSQPQLLEIRTGPFPECKCFHQLRGLWRFSFVSSPFFNYHWWNYKMATVERKHSELKSRVYLKLCMQETLIQKHHFKTAIDTNVLDYIAKLVIQSLYGLSFNSDHLKIKCMQPSVH